MATVEMEKTDGGKKTDRREMRRRAMLDAANTLFLEKGYGATSLTDIVKRSGGSLATLYELFGGKEGLFRAMVEEACIEFFGFLHDHGSETPLREKLREIGRRFLEGVLEDEGAFFRVVVSEAGQFPEVGAAFYSAGPAYATKIIGDYLAKEVERGVIKIDDTQAMARSLVSVLIYDIQTKLLCRVPVKLTRRQIDRHVDGVVDSFMKLYAVSEEATPPKKGDAGKKRS